MKLSVCLALALCLLCGPLWPRPARADASAVTVTRIHWGGWNDAWKLSNGIVDAVVVPEIGRIMTFQYAGRPQTNAVYQNPQWAGKTEADTDPAQWANFGGDKLWPAPQLDWPLHAPRAWPPDPAFDGDPQIARRVPNGLELVAAPSTSFAARAVRLITMKPGEARLYVTQTLTKDADAAGARDAFPVGLWTITQARADGAVLLPLPPLGDYVQGLPLGTTRNTPLPPGWSLQDRVLVGHPDPFKSHKVGLIPGGGWIALLYGGRTLFSKHHPIVPGALYPDGGCGVEVYLNTPPAAYIELETLGPLVSLTHGQAMSDTLFWQLDTLPRAPRTDAEAAALARAILSR